MKITLFLIKILVLLNLIFHLSLASDDILKMPEFKKVLLDNGLELWLSKTTEKQGVFFKFYFPNGQLFDPLNKEGSVELMVDLLDENTQKYSGFEIAQKINHVGGSLVLSSDAYHSYAYCHVLKKDSDLAIDLLSQVLIYPEFTLKDMDRLKTQFLLSIQKSQKQPEYLIQQQFYAHMYDGSQRLARSESIKSIKQITLEDINQVFKSCINPKGAVLVVMGDIDISLIEKKLTQAFSNWKGKQSNNMVNTAIRYTSDNLVLIDKKDLNQSHLVLAMKGLRQNEVEYPAYRIMNYVLGGAGFSSRLMEKIRSEKGLTYSIYSNMVQNPDEAFFVISTFTKNDNLPQMLKEIQQLINEFVQKGITSQELANAQSYFKGNLPIRYETPIQKADFLYTARRYQLSEQKAKQILIDLLNLKLIDVNDFIKSYFKHNPFQTILLTDYQKIKDLLKSEAIALDKIIEIE